MWQAGPNGEDPTERADRAIDIATLTWEQFDLFMAGYEAGRATGFDDGYTAAEERHAEAHRRAVEHMRANHDFISPDEALDVAGQDVDDDAAARAKDVQC